MANSSKIIIGNVVSIDESGSAGSPLNRSVAKVLKTQFDDGQIALLDADADSGKMFGLLQKLQRHQVPSYTVIDSDTGLITTVRIPLVGMIVKANQLPSGDIDIELSTSHARHILRTSNPQFGSLSRFLRSVEGKNAFVAIVENDGGEIIDVRAPNSSSANLTHYPSSKMQVGAAFAPPTITASRASQLFNLVSDTSCAGLAPSTNCIPFLYPDDGCWARASAMCQIMAAAGSLPGKMWIYGHLSVLTDDNPTCSVDWFWHVAPVFYIPDGAGKQLQIIDPSIFSSPMPAPTWELKQRDPNAITVLTDPSIYLRTIQGQVQTDPTYTRTAADLTFYRLKLEERSMSGTGPPPYPFCQIAPSSSMNIA